MAELKQPEPGVSRRTLALETIAITLDEILKELRDYKERVILANNLTSRR